MDCQHLVLDNQTRSGNVVVYHQMYVDIQLY
jgi:hypothetical protein